MDGLMIERTNLLAAFKKYLNILISNLAVFGGEYVVSAVANHGQHLYE
jgi:hypothetical protein